MLLVICGINLPEVTYKPLHEQNCYDKLRCRSIKCFLLLIIILLFVMPLFEVLQPFFSRKADVFIRYPLYRT